MGVKKLGRLIEIYAPKSITEHNYYDYNGTIQSIDASMQLYRYVIAIRTQNGGDILTSNGEFASHIHGVWHKICNVIKHGIQTVWIFDGEPPNIKNNVLRERKKIKNKAENLLLTGSFTELEKPKLMKRTYCVKKEHIDDLQTLCKLCGIPTIQAIGEAETQCAALTKAGKTYGAVTEDWDALPFGTIYMLKDFSSKKKVKQINLNILLKDLDLTLEQFIDICIILGTDYCSGIKGMGPNIVYSEYKTAGNIPNLIKRIKKINDEQISKGNEPLYIIPPDFENKWETVKKYYTDVQVIDPNCSTLDLTWKKPDIEGLERFLCDKFELDRTKTKENIKMIANMYNKYKNTVTIN